MDIDIKRWFSILSACTLGWLSGFVVYGFIVANFSPEIFKAYPQHQAQSVPLQHANEFIHHAVVRVISPRHTAPSIPELPPVLPQNSGKVLLPPRSYFL